MLNKLKNIGVFGNVCEPLYVYYLRGGNNRSASDGFVGRNKAMVDMVSRSSDKYKFKSWLFAHIWSVYRYVPKSIIPFIRPLVSKKKHRKLSKQEVQTLSKFFD